VVTCACLCAGKAVVGHERQATTDAEYVCVCSCEIVMLMFCFMCASCVCLCAGKAVVRCSGHAPDGSKDQQQR
jgi:hypothetical protein